MVPNMRLAFRLAVFVLLAITTMPIVAVGQPTATKSFTTIQESAAPSRATDWHFRGHVRMQVPRGIAENEPFRVVLSVTPEDLDSLTPWSPHDVLIATNVLLTDRLQIRLAGAEGVLRIRPLTSELQQIRFDSTFVFEVTALKPGRHVLRIVIGTFDETDGTPAAPHERIVTTVRISVEHRIVPRLLRAASNPQIWMLIIAAGPVVLLVWSRIWPALWKRYQTSRKPKMGF